MSLALKNLSRWWSRGKQKDTKLENGASTNPNPNPDPHLWESEALKPPLMVGGNGVASKKTRRMKRKLDTRQEQEIDREHDVVLVPSDGIGGCISDSDSDASDWSVGWSEPHGPDFLSEDEIDGGFNVLVPCYGPKHRDAGEGASEVVEMKDNKKYMEQWLYSLQTS